MGLWKKIRTNMDGKEVDELDGNPVQNDALFIVRMPDGFQIVLISQVTHETVTYYDAGKPSQATRARAFFPIWYHGFRPWVRAVDVEVIPIVTDASRKMARKLTKDPAILDRLK